jgi:hypothetical protein
MRRLLTIFSVLAFAVTTTNAQFYVGPYIGFKASGLKGAVKLSTGGAVQTGNVADGGSTGFNAGIATGYQVLPSSIAGGLYKLDINLDISWASFNYFENSYNSAIGSGKFSANGLSGGKTNVFAFDIMPIHRFNFKNFILSPYAGLGFGINLLMTSDVTVGPPSGTGTLTSVSGLKMGLLVFYGTLFNVSNLIKPYIQFKHIIPFGSETQFTDSYQAAQGGGSGSWAYYVADVPGYFNLVGGVRFELN